MGSGARGTEDEWSDIDLLLQLDPTADEPAVVADWTDSIDKRFGVADTLDVFAVGVRYRVHLLTSSLQIDVSFWPHDQFRATEPGFRLLFGSPTTPTEPAPSNPDQVIGWAWLFAIHARSSIARGKRWQAAMMIDELRNRVIDLKCFRAGLNPWHGREVDQLPPVELEQLAATRTPSLATDELDAARVALVTHLEHEVALLNPARAARLAPAFTELRRAAR